MGRRSRDRKREPQGPAQASGAASEAPSGKARAAAALALAVLAAFSNCLRNGFVWDDEQFIEKNAYLASASQLPKLLTENIVAGAGHRSNLYRPLQSLTHFADVRLWGLSPRGHHLTNLAIHAGAAVAAFAWLARLAPWPAALCASALYSLHPLQSEAVAYVSGRGDLLGVLFLCLGLLLYERSIVLSLLMALLGVLSKESLALFPVFLFLHCRAAGLPFDWRRQLPFWLLSGAYVLLRLTVLEFQDTLNFYGAENILTRNPSYRLFTYLSTLPTALRLWLWPSDLHHERAWSVYTSLGHARVLLGGFGLLSWLGLAAWNWRRRPAVAAGLLWCVAATAPTSNLVVLINALFYDHWFLLPGLGLALAAVGLPVLQAPLGRVLCAALALACGAAARAQNRVWESHLTLFSQILRYEPRSAKSHNNLAMALAEAGRLEDAARHYREGIRLSDEFPQTHHNLARLLLQLGRPAEAEAEYRRALALDPRFHYSHLELGGLLLGSGRLGEAESHFRRAVEAYPYASRARLGLAELALRAGRREEALAQLREGLRLREDPELRAALERLAGAAPAR